jgi:Flp pilus assembly pilin Flp
VEVVVFLSAWVVSWWHTRHVVERHGGKRRGGKRQSGKRHSDERGQATAEYALVLLGAAAVAILLIAWATSGSGAGKIGDLLDKVLDTITSKVA